MVYKKSKKSKIVVARKSHRRRHVPRTIQSKMPGFPANHMVKLRYVDYFSLNPGAAAIGKQYYCANGLYDPDLSGAGHQPIGFDQWSNFYNHYTVSSSKITVEANIGTTSTLPAPATIGVTLVDDSTIPTVLTTLMENGLSNFKNVPVNANSGMTHKFTKSFSAKKFFNIKDVKDNETRIGASIFANPSEQGVFAIWMACIDGAEDLPITWFTATIEYNVIFSEPKSLEQS